MLIITPVLDNVNTLLKLSYAVQERSACLRQSMRAPVSIKGGVCRSLAAFVCGADKRQQLRQSKRAPLQLPPYEDRKK